MEQREIKRPVRNHLTLQRQIVTMLIHKLDADNLHHDEKYDSGAGQRACSLSADAERTNKSSSTQHADVGQQGASVRAEELEDGEILHLDKRHSITRVTSEPATGLKNDTDTQQAKSNQRPQNRRRRSTTFNPAAMGTAPVRFSVKLKEGKTGVSSMDLFEGESNGEHVAEADKDTETSSAVTTETSWLPEASFVGGADEEHEQNNQKQTEEDDFCVPDEREISSIVQQVEDEAPALQYKVVCTGDHALYTYTSSVAGFIKDIASNEADYQLTAVHNWWNDIEKFSALQAHFISRRHGVKFQVTFHTLQSWDSHVAHVEHLRQQFDTVIKTDIMFEEDPNKLASAKESLRREDMWKEKWSRIR